LSLFFEVYSFPQHAANGRTVAGSLNLSLENGHSYQLSELFKTGSDYQDRIDAVINQGFEAKDWPQIKEFAGIGPQAGYYLTERALDIYFQEVEYTPHYVGIPVFEAPYPAVSDIVSPQGLVSRVIEKPGSPLTRTAVNLRYR
jgi:hypothetical protein